MDRRDRTSVASFFRAEPCAVGESLDLDGDALQHALVRRLAAGDALRFVDGKGSAAFGNIIEAAKRTVRATIASVEQLPPPSALELLVPVADKDRMLLAAEKCVELQATAWRPVRWERSHSVAGAGAGEKFGDRVLARMRSALEQSGGAWLPSVHAELGPREALRAVDGRMQRFVLDADGAPLVSVLRASAVALAVGPEGGLSNSELDEAVASGWILASVGTSTLRFETAIIAGAAVVRAHLSTGNA